MKNLKYLLLILLIISISIKSKDDSFRIISNGYNRNLKNNIRLAQWYRVKKNFEDRLANWDSASIENLTFNQYTEKFGQTSNGQYKFKPDNLLSPLSIIKDTFLVIIKNGIIGFIKVFIIPFVKSLIKLIPEVILNLIEILKDLIHLILYMIKSLPILLELLISILIMIVEYGIMISKNIFNSIDFMKKLIIYILSKFKSTASILDNFNIILDFIINLFKEIPEISTIITENHTSRTLNMMRISQSLAYTNLKVYHIITLIPKVIKYILTLLSDIINRTLDITGSSRLYDLGQVFIKSFEFLKLIKFDSFIPIIIAISQLIPNTFEYTLSLTDSDIIKFFQNLWIWVEFIFSSKSLESLKVIPFPAIFIGLTNVTLVYFAKLEMFFRIVNKASWILQDLLVKSPTTLKDYLKASLLRIEWASFVEFSVSFFDMSESLGTDSWQTILSIPWAEIPNLLDTIDLDKTKESFLSFKSINMQSSEWSSSVLNPKLTDEVTEFSSVSSPTRVISFSSNASKVHSYYIQPLTQYAKSKPDQTSSISAPTGAALGESIAFVRVVIFFLLYVIFGSTFYSVNGFALDGIRSMIKKDKAFKRRKIRDKFGDPRYGELLTKVMREVKMDYTNDQYEAKYY